jgi:O-antigen/teichoic acid export membrane protein
MLVHYSTADAATALADVGNYHAARVLPLPLVAIAALLRSALLPHLSHDWEAGRRESVRGQLNFMLKIWGLTMLIVSTGLVLAAPTFFEVAFRGKYLGGQNVFTLTVVYLGWEAMAAVATTYLWCAERPGLGSLSWAAGLAVNIGLNLLLVPRYGLHGAVIGTAVANLAGLALAQWLNAQMGAPASRAVWVITLAPAALLVGPAAGCAVALLLVHQAWSRSWLLTAEERRRLLGFVRRK